MKKCLQRIHGGTLVLMLSALSFVANGQTLEWRLANATYSAVDPDGAGPATGSVTFTLQIHTVSGTINNVNVIATGFSFQSANVMIPTPTAGPGCPSTVDKPANVVMSSTFTTAGFVYNTVNECGAFSQTTGGQTFDSRAVGSVEAGTINLNTTYVDVFTVTLWTLGSTTPPGGFAVINSSNGGTPAPFGTYSVSDNLANEYATNSLTYTTPLALGPGTLPVVFTKFDANCVDKGTLISWKTATELNSNNYEVQKSSNGIDWVKIGTVPASFNSTTQKSYQYLDLESGSSYYRLAQVDADGKKNYTSIIRSSCESKQFTVVLYPIPARDKLNVVIRSDRNIHTEFQIFDVHGKIVRRIPTTVNFGNNNFVIGIQNLAAGEYILRSSNPTIDINKKFVIAR